MEVGDILMVGEEFVGEETVGNLEVWVVFVVGDYCFGPPSESGVTAATIITRKGLDK